MIVPKKKVFKNKFLCFFVFEIQIENFFKNPLFQENFSSKLLYSHTFSKRNNIEYNTKI